MEQTMDKRTLSKFDVDSVFGKIVVIVVLALLLLIPLTQVENQIGDRADYQKAAQQQVAQGWGGDVRFNSAYLSAGDRRVHPSSADTTVSVDSKEKKRGVFSVPVYVATLSTTVNFAKSPPGSPRPEKDKITSSKEYLIVPFKPVTSIQSFKVTEAASGKDLNAKLTDEGLKIGGGESADFYAGPIRIEITARGTGPLTYESNADQDKVSMKGNWRKPKYIDDILPGESKLNGAGFAASWILNALPKRESGDRQAKVVGLSHLWQSTDYLMIERAVKYGILFIALTFLLVFIVEFTAKVKIHPLQYASIGLAISLFYLLLLAISETAGFNSAYAISTLAVTGLITFYVQGFLRQKKFTYLILGEQLTLSGFFYLLLSLEESAFLMGSIGLFAALAIFMSVTRRFDWYTGSFRA